MPGVTLKGKIQLDGSQWKSGLDQAKRQGSRFATETGAIIKSRLAAAFGVFGLVRGIGDAFSRGAEVRDRSRALGIDPETFQQIDFAATQSGASIDDAAKAMKRLAVVQIDAQRGSKDLQEALGRYGVTVEHLKRLSPDKLFFLLAEQVEKGVNKTKQLGDLQKLLGRSGGNLIPAFETGFARAAQDAVDRGTVISPADIMALGRAQDEVDTKKFQAAKIAATSIGAGVRVSEQGGVSMEDLAAILMDAFGGKGNQQRQLEALLEIKRSARDTATNTGPLNGF